MSRAPWLRRRDVVLLSVVVVLFLFGGLAWWVWTQEFEERRAEVLAGLPPFPSAPDAGLARRQAPARPRVEAPPLPVEARSHLEAFVLAPTGNLAVVQVNALVNTPFYARLEACLRQEFEGLADAGVLFGGLDVKRDVDRVALVPGGVAVSGSFAPDFAARLAQQWPGAVPASYRDVQIYAGGDGCVAQVGSLLLLGSSHDGCAALIDRALAPVPQSTSADPLESDLYTRTDLSALRAAAAQEPAGSPLSEVTEGLEQVTLRANVWDQVALSIDATPKGGGKDGLSQLARLSELALQAGQTQMADDPAWSALLDQSKVNTAKGHLLLDVALPAEALFDRLQLPCGRPDAG
jgi:hypothetical protein